MESISTETRQSYSEVYELINLLDCEYIDKIPKKLLEFFEREMDRNYIKNINPYEDISKQNLKKETITILAMLNLKYWADEEEKANLNKIYNENERKYQEEIREKYNPDKIFEKVNDTSKVMESEKIEETVNHQETEALAVPEKKGFFSRLISFIKGKLFKS